MNYKVVIQYLKDKGFKVLDRKEEEAVSAYNVTTLMVVSWIITNHTKRPHSVRIANSDTTNIKFNGRISNLQEFNNILKAVE